MKDYGLEYRKFVIGGVAALVVVIYIVRLFSLQLMSDDFKKNADSNAFLKKVEFPSRGIITDRNGELMVYNQPSYDIMVIVNEARDHIDTLEFCQALGITREEFLSRMEAIRKLPGYSRFTQQMFKNQLSEQDFSIFQEKMFRFPGFYVQKRSVRRYEYPCAAHILGDVAEVSKGDIEADDYYQPGDYIGKQGVERFYEKQLRGEKGVHCCAMPMAASREATRTVPSTVGRWLARTSLWPSIVSCRHWQNGCWRARSGPSSLLSHALERCFAWHRRPLTIHVPWWGDSVPRLTPT